MNAPLDEPRWFSLGPHGYFDLVRLARCGRSVIVRIAYILILYAALAVVYRDVVGRASTLNGMREGQVDRWLNVNARIAERFCITVLVTQNIAVLVLLPIYCAASIFEERDKRTLPILFTTHLTAREILLGKLVSRVGHVGGILLAGLPVLAIAQLWGGIDMEMIAANFLGTAFSMFSIGSLSLMLAIQSRTLIGALLKTYAFLAVVGFMVVCCCGALTFPVRFPFLIQPSLGNPTPYGFMWGFVACLLVAHFAFFRGCSIRAAQCLDSLRGDETMPAELLDVDTKLAQYNREVREVGDDPLMWKELHLEPASWAHFIPVMFLPYIIMIALVLVPPHLQMNDTQAREARGLFLFFLFGSGAGYTLFLALRLAGCIVRERERQTLEALLVLPVTPGDILHAKLTGNLYRYWSWLLPVGLSWLVLQFFGNVTWLGGFFILFAIAVHCYFFAMLALCLSVHCQSSMAAYVILGMTLIASVIGTAAFAELTGVGGGAFVTATNPLACWLEIAGNGWLRGKLDYPNAAMINLAGYLAAGLYFHVAAHVSFARRAV